METQDWKRVCWRRIMETHVKVAGNAYWKREPKQKRSLVVPAGDFLGLEIPHERRFQFAWFPGVSIRVSNPGFMIISSSVFKYIINFLISFSDSLLFVSGNDHARFVNVSITFKE
jgi:hypothetical protein